VTPSVLVLTLGPAGGTPTLLWGTFAWGAVVRKKGRKVQAQRVRAVRAPQLTAGQARSPHYALGTLSHIHTYSFKENRR
jgi:hypothetical protein